MALALLTHRAVLSVSGPEAGTFLQGLVTNDIERGTPGGALYAGLLTPQGKLLFDFFVIDRGADGFLLDCEAARAKDLAKRLTLYRLRAKVAIAISDLAV